MSRQPILIALSFYATLITSALASNSQLTCLLKGDCFQDQEVMRHLKTLQKIAENNGGHRAAGSAGHEMSANHIAQQLLAAGYKVELQPFRFMQFEKLSAHFQRVSPGSINYQEEKDFNVMTYSGSGAISAPVWGVDLQWGPGNDSTSGCEAQDFINFPTGHIALIQRGSCPFSQKVELAQAAGAAGVIIFNQGNTPEREELLNGTLAEGGQIKIPVFSVSYPFAIDLVKYPEAVIAMNADTVVEQKTSFNVIAETRSGNADNVVMIGAHLDSVKEGPGINDNGSGSAGILAVALKMKDIKVNNKVRFAWFSAEELGLIGSTKYVEALSPKEKAQISLFINVDMIGSPNYMIGVYDGDGSSFGTKGPEGSGALEQMFHQYFAGQGVKSVETELNGRSDYAAFSAAGIAVAGIFTGAEAKKTEAEAVLFGGVAGEAYDSCYHKACDDLDNISSEALQLNTNAIAFMAQHLSHSTASVRDGQKSMVGKIRMPVVFPAHLHCHGDEHAE